MADKQLCIACEERPAAPGSGPVALCSHCKSEATKGSRGVKFDSEKPGEATN